MALDELPAPSARRVAVRLTKDAQRQLRGGHPWVYAESITSISHDGAVGDLAVVFDDDRRFLAIGLYDPTSPIRVRVLHRGAPRPVDAAFFTERLEDALARRAAIVADARTTAYRCVHGENDALPGLVIDRYDDVLVFKLDTPAWIAHLSTIVPLTIERTGATTAVLRLSRHVRDAAHDAALADGEVLMGPPPPSPVHFLENGLRFEADVVRGQKTGHFLDQRANRAKVRDLARGGPVGRIERHEIDQLQEWAHPGFGGHAGVNGECRVARQDRMHEGAVEEALRRVCGGGFVTCRFTHVYPDGPAPYYTVLAPSRLDRSIEQWSEIKIAAAEALLRLGGTITHHHAVGRDHRAWYDRQRPAAFARALRAAKQELDPHGILNPGVLIDP